MADEHDEDWADIDDPEASEDFDFDDSLDENDDTLGFDSDDDDLTSVESDDLDEDDDMVAEEVTDRKAAFSRSRSGRFKTTVKKRSGRNKRSKRQAKKMAPVMEGALKNKPFTSYCSECYEEFAVDPNFEADRFNCPECDHPSKGPDEDFLRGLYGVKKNENFYLLMAIISFSIIVLILLVWQLLLIDPTTADSSALNWGFTALLLISFVSGIYFGIMYEIRRYETYF